MLVSQMAVGLHRQNTAVLVSEPFRHGGNVHARFDAPSCEQMSQIVVRQMMKAELLAGACQGPVEFANAENRGIQKLLLAPRLDRKSTRLNSSHLVISYAVFCLKKKK